ncbi:alpha/beta fold hydrolase [Pendulispora albinea]|uniref:Alpha/beta hydrolase n=1 Tax=Pendulispora albinea TaxID=2741071 RepID=A0ABZ2LYW4_9BACT
MSQDVDLRRRRFLGTAALTMVATSFGAFGCAKAYSEERRPASPPIKPGAHTSLGPIRQIDAGLLNVGYAEAGPADGPAVLLLHGWPYDIHSFVDVAPLLASAGYRVIVPHLRGHGTTRFLSDKTFRNAQQSAVAFDILALMDALRIPKAILAGYDWGGAHCQHHRRALARAMQGDGLGQRLSDQQSRTQPTAAPPKAEHGWWYQYYFATERGRAGYGAYRRELANLVWKVNSPKWGFDDTTFERSAASFDNPDYIDIVIHNYRWRLSLAAGEPRYDEVEQRLAAGPVISVPTITLDGDSDGVAPATDGTAYAAKFSGRRTHRIVQGAGHNLPQEAPQAFADAVIEVDRY